MHHKKDSIVSKQEFLKNGSYAKEEYEGLLVASDLEQNCYNIGVQLAEDKVLVVDQARDTDIADRLQNWVPQVQEIQRRYGVTNNLGNYSK